MKFPKATTSTWGKKSKLLPTKTGLNTLNKSPRSVMDYAKQVPTIPTDDPNPLLVDLMRKP